MGVIDKPTEIHTRTLDGGRCAGFPNSGILCTSSERGFGCCGIPYGGDVGCCFDNTDAGVALIGVGAEPVGGGIVCESDRVPLPEVTLPSERNCSSVPFQIPAQSWSL